MAPRLGAWLSLGLVVGCGPARDLDDAGGSGTAGAGTATSTTGADSSSTSPIPPPTTAGPSTKGSDGCVDGCTSIGEPPPACPASEAFTCSAPVPCDGANQCGDPNSPFDDQGCLRPLCRGEEDCEADEVCHRPQDWGYCVGSGQFCFEEQQGRCVCGGKPDCGGTFCVEADRIPPVDCSAQSPATCTAAGCTLAMGRRITDAGGGSCLCDVLEAVCLYAPPDAKVISAARLYYDPITQEVIKLDTWYDPPPFGWTSCLDLDLPPALCECADLLPCDL